MTDGMHRWTQLDIWLEVFSTLDELEIPLKEDWIRRPSSIYSEHTLAGRLGEVNLITEVYTS